MDAATCPASQLNVSKLALFLFLFLPGFPAMADTFIRADANGDRAVDISDPIGTLTFLFLGGANSPSCMDALDANDDGALDVSDGIYSLSFLFLGSSPPPFPYPDLGVDPTDDSLACLSLLTIPSFPGTWNGTFQDDDNPYVVVLEVIEEGERSSVVSGMESLGNAILGGEVFILDPPAGPYRFSIDYKTEFDCVTFLFDCSPDRKRLTGEFLTTSGTSGSASLVLVESLPALGGVAGGYLMTLLGGCDTLDGGDDDCDDLVWGGTVVFDAAGAGTAEVLAGSLESADVAIALAAPTEGSAYLDYLFEGSLVREPDIEVHYTAFRGLDTGIISGWYEDPLGTGMILFEPAAIEE
jgi:hypothetical protein